MAEPSDPPKDSGPISGDILVVDDNPKNLVAINAALESLADQLVLAQSGREALRHLLQREFSLILLDVLMPSMDGFQTARLIREREKTRHVPIIFITSYNRDDRDILEAYSLGAVDFLFKPIVPEILRAKASVFINLQKRTQQVAQQAKLLWEHEKSEHERRMAEERRRWEEESLRRQMEEERKNAEDAARRADELARTIRELERAEKELTHSNERLAESDKRKDEFLALLAHELRNPLAPLVTSLELLQMRIHQDSTSARLHETMNRQVEHLRRLVDDLLDVSRINSGKIELARKTIDLGDVVQQAVAMCSSLIEKRRHELVVRLPSEPMPLHADAVRMTQVIANLLHNAARYTEEGGRLCVMCARDGDAMVVEVSDNGRGIAAEHLDRVFDMFAQGSMGAGGGGLGLGLTLVRRLIELHGGTVSAASEGPGKGSMFTVRVPVGNLAHTTERVPVLQAPTNGESPLRIAIIDDNADIRQTLRDLLEAHGHTVRVAEDGARGLELVLAEKPDVALIDIDLPHLDGYGVAREVRSALPAGGPRLVALTGFGQKPDRERAFEAGFNEHLVKPASSEVLLRALREE